jgi:sugar lactone lactonase YvrE
MSSHLRAYAACAVLLLAADLGCSSRCAAGFVERDGVCVDPTGDGSLPLCSAAPPGRYEGLTDQGLPVSFELTADRKRVVNFAIDVVLIGDGPNRPTHQVRIPAGLPMSGCAFAGVIVNSEFSGAFLPPQQFAGAYYDTFLLTDTMTILPASGQWTASLVAPLDGGVAFDGAVADGAIPFDAGTIDAGALDAGTLADGGASTALVLPPGFRADVLASGLLGPIALAHDTAGDALYVAEYFAGQVTRITLATGARAAIATGLASPAGVSIAGAGTPGAKLYTAHAGGLLVQSLSGGAAQAFGPSLSFAPGPLHCSEAGVCHVVEFSFGRRAQALWRVTSAAATIVADADAGIDQPFGLAGSSAGLLVAEANLGFPSADGVLLHELDPDGGVTSLNATLLAQPGALAPLRADLFFVSEVVLASGGDRRVFLFDRVASSTRAFAAGFALPMALAFDAARGVLYVADLSRGVVVRIEGPFGTL